MSRYRNTLREEGLADTRVYSLADAIEMLHAAMCKLDNGNLALFRSKTIEQRLQEYAQTEQLRDVTKDRD